MLIKKGIKSLSFMDVALMLIIKLEDDKEIFNSMSNNKITDISNLDP